MGIFIYFFHLKIIMIFQCGFQKWLFLLSFLVVKNERKCSHSKVYGSSAESWLERQRIRIIFDLGTSKRS